MSNNSPNGILYIYYTRINVTTKIIVFVLYYHITSTLNEDIIIKVVGKLTLIEGDIMNDTSIIDPKIPITPNIDNLDPQGQIVT